MTTSLRTSRKLDLAANELKAEWDKVMILWNKTIDAKNTSYGVVDDLAKNRSFQNDYFEQLWTGNDYCENVKTCPFILKTFYNINFVNTTTYNLFGLNPKNFSMADNL